MHLPITGVTILYTTVSSISVTIGEKVWITGKSLILDCARTTHNMLRQLHWKFVNFTLEKKVFVSIQYSVLECIYALVTSHALVMPWLQEVVGVMKKYSSPRQSFSWPPQNYNQSFQQHLSLPPTSLLTSVTLQYRGTHNPEIERFLSKFPPQLQAFQLFSAAHLEYFVAETVVATLPWDGHWGRELTPPDRWSCWAAHAAEPHQCFDTTATGQQNVLLENCQVLGKRGPLGH